MDESVLDQDWQRHNWLYNQLSFDLPKVNLKRRHKFTFFVMKLKHEEKKGVFEEFLSQARFNFFIIVISKK